MSNESSENMIPVSETDFLEEDQAIRGQNYACLSFLSPEDVLKDKESYFVASFLEKYVERNNELMNGLELLFSDKSDEIRSIKEQYNIYFDGSKIDEEYKAFKKENESKISEKYLQENNFRTCVRGVKVRGTYETLKEAQIRAEVLKRKDNNKHNIYIAQVGCWCPWSANPDDIQSPEYSETQLNTLMNEYMKNQQNKDEFYNERKEELMKRASDLNIKKQKSIEEGSSSSDTLTNKESNENKKNVIESLDEEDSWMQNKGKSKLN